MTGSHGGRPLLRPNRRARSPVPDGSSQSPLPTRRLPADRQDRSAGAAARQHQRTPAAPPCPPPSLNRRTEPAQLDSSIYRLWGCGGGELGGWEDGRGGEAAYQAPPHTEFSMVSQFPPITFSIRLR